MAWLQRTFGTPTLSLPTGRRPRRRFRRHLARRAKYRWSVQLAIFIIWMIFILTIVVPWIASHPRTPALRSNSQIQKER